MLATDAPVSQQTPAQQAPARLHLDYLDGVRAFAALYVTLFHGWTMLWGAGPKPTGLTYRLTAWAMYGHWSVCIFIVLSGFCLMLPVVRGDGTLRGGMKRFFQRRARRILPPYYFAAALSLLLIWTVIGQKTGTTWDKSLHVTSGGILAHLLLIQDAYETATPKDWYSQINYVFWSVAVEWQIYFAFPVLVLLWRRIGAWRATSCAVVLAYGLVILLHKTPLIGLTPQFLALFALGMLGATVAFSATPDWQRLRDRFPWGVFTVAMLALIILLMQNELKYGRLLDFFVGLATCGGLMVMARPGPSALRRLFSWRPLVFVGTFSYSLYLLHAPILQLLWQYGLHPLGWKGLGMFAALEGLGVPAVIAGAYLFFLGCERPFLNTPKTALRATQPGDVSVQKA